MAGQIPRYNTAIETYEYVQTTETDAKRLRARIGNSNILMIRLQSFFLSELGL